MKTALGKLKKLLEDIHKGEYKSSLPLCEWLLRSKQMGLNWSLKA
jgi:hypothetical protein